MVVSWFSAGVSSFIAAYMEKDNIDKLLYIHINDQHEDSMRFIKDCEKVLGKEIEIIQSRYKSVNEVIQQFKFINSAYGSKCTQVLKKRVRQEWEYGQKDLTYIWGYDIEERHRAERLVETMPDFKHKFPLIEKQFKKEDCHGLLAELGIKRPAMYDMGYRNNNCIGCVKGGMGYWNRIRKDFPEVFEQRAAAERMVGRSCIKGVFLDELDPERGKLEDEVMQECGIICQLGISDLI